MALSRQHIARSGLKLLNEVGLNGLTLRLIAADRGVEAPALYWHLKSKQELLDGGRRSRWGSGTPSRTGRGPCAG